MYEILLAIVFIILLITLLTVVFFKKDEEAKEGFDFVIGAALGKKKFKESKMKRLIAKGLNKVKNYNIEDPIVGPVIDILNPRFNYEGDFDLVTHDILDKKKERLIDLNSNIKDPNLRDLRDLNNLGNLKKLKNVKELLHQVMLRIEYTNNEIAKENLILILDELENSNSNKSNSEDISTVLKNSIKEDLCLYDKEVELMSCFILNDEDLILYNPFFNENLIEQEIRLQIIKIMKSELAEYPQEIQDAYHDGKEEEGIDFRIKKNTIKKIKELYKDKDELFLNSIIRKCIEFE